MATNGASLEDDGPAPSNRTPLLLPEPYAASVAVPLKRSPGFHHGHRPCRDAFFLVLFLGLLVAIAGIGAVSIQSRNRDFFRLIHPDALDDPQNCRNDHHHNDNSDAAQAVPLLLPPAFPGGNYTDADVAWAFVPPLVLTGLVSFILGILLLGIIQACPTFMVYSTVGVVILAPAVVGAAAFILKGDMNDITSLVAPAACSLLLLLIFCFIQRRLSLTARLLATAGTALHQNAGLLFFVPFLKLIHLLLIAPGPVLMAVAYMNGGLDRNPELGDQDPCGPDGPQCCAWKPRRFVYPYIALVAFSMLWITYLAFEIRLYTIAGTVAQWYFAEYGRGRKSSLTRSLRHALGPSLGTLCLSSFLLSVFQALRNAAQRSYDQRQNSLGQSPGGLAACFVSCCVDCLLAVLRYVTQYAVIFAAITGDGFCASSRSAYDLLSRNGLSTVAVDFVSTIVLRLNTLLIAAGWAALVGFFCYLEWSEAPAPGFNVDDAVGLAAGEAVATLLIALVVLNFFASVLLNSIDTVYVCFAQDRDAGFVSYPEVHEVYATLPAMQYPVVFGPGAYPMAIATPSLQGPSNYEGIYAPPPPELIPYRSAEGAEEQ